jgi:hypothetical protein
MSRPRRARSGYGRPLANSASTRRPEGRLRAVGAAGAAAAGGLAVQPDSGPTGRGERAFALAERLGSVNAATATLGTTWPSLRKAFTRHSLDMPARNPEEVRRRVIGAACQRTT